jgi:hypothetical protein
MGVASSLALVVGALAVLVIVNDVARRFAFDVVCVFLIVLLLFLIPDAFTEPPDEDESP